MRDDAKQLVFVVNSVAFFVSHRLPIGLAALQRGWKVTAVAGHEGSPVMDAEVEGSHQKAGIDWIHARFGTSSVNPASEMRGLLDVINAVRRLRPAVVHTASAKGLLYGGIAARLWRVSRLVVSI